jgi:hypothetical protein
MHPQEEREGPSDADHFLDPTSIYKKQISTGLFEKKKNSPNEKKMAAKSGYVYAIANNAMPGLVKIGATTRDPLERLHEALAWQASAWG